MLSIPIKNGFSDSSLTRRNNIFFYCFLATLVSDVVKIQELYPPLNIIFFQKIIGSIAFVGILIDPYARKILRERILTSQGKALLFLAFWILMSIPLSIYPGNSFRFLTQYFWKVILMYVLILGYTFTYERMIRIIWAYILAIGLLALVYCSGAGTSSGLDLTVGYDANDLAFAFVTAFGFVFYKLFSTKGIKRVMIGLLSILLLFAIVKTESRGGFLGLIAVAGVILFQLKHLGRRYFIAGLVFCLIGGILLSYVGDSKFWNRMSTIINYQDDYNVTESAGRIAVWKRGIGIMMAKPLLGVGVSNFYTAEGYSHNEVGGKWSAAHNSFVEIGVDLGFPGLICFCYIILNSLKGIKKRRFIQNKGAFNNTILTQCSIVSSWIGFFVTGFFLSEAYSLLFYFLAGVSCVFKVLVSDRDLSKGQDGAGQKAG